MTSTTLQSDRPIGFWLKLVDRLIDERFAELLGSRELTRRHWQVLNVIEQGDGRIEEIDDRLRPFLDEQEPTVRPVVDDLVDRGWAESDGGRVTLTAEGERQFATLQRDVAKQRRDLVANITPEEYAATLSVLERMATNLGWREREAKRGNNRISQEGSVSTPPR